MKSSLPKISSSLLLHAFFTNKDDSFIFFFIFVIYAATSIKKKSRRYIRILKRHVKNVFSHIFLFFSYMYSKIETHLGNWKKVEKYVLSLVILFSLTLGYFLRNLYGYCCKVYTHNREKLARTIFTITGMYIIAK
jgi:hypothetical protein